MDGISAVVFRGRMHPVDLANRLARHADLIVAEGPVGPQIPNSYRVAVAPTEIDEGLSIADLERELTYTLAATAAERGWRTGGPVQVEVITRSDVPGGSIDCETEIAPGTMTPWGQLIEMPGGRAFAVTDNRTLIGRGPGTDVDLEEPEVSRRHAVLFRQEGAVWITDLQSSNGTAINGEAVDGTPTQVLPGDLIRFGPATFTFRLL